MPCNAAVTITKAAISAQHLQALLTSDIVIAVLRAYLLSDGYQDVPGSWNWDAERVHEKVFCLVPNSASKKLAAIDFRIRGDWGIGLYYDVTTGQVRSTTTADASWGREWDQTAEAEHLVAGAAKALADAADQLFARQVQEALTAIGRPMTTEIVTVENEGQSQTATVITLRV